LTDVYSCVVVTLTLRDNDGTVRFLRIGKNSNVSKIEFHYEKLLIDLLPIGTQIPTK
jgi:hypothetical protein